jgi:hypothetical protein
VGKVKYVGAYISMIANVLVMGTLLGISDISILLNPRLKQLLLSIFSHQEAN